MSGKPPIEPVTFKDSKKCTQTYDHSHSVTGVPEVVCGEGSDEKAKAIDAAKKGAKPETAADSEAKAHKDERDAKASEAKVAKKAAKNDGVPKSGKTKLA